MTIEQRVAILENRCRLLTMGLAVVVGFPLLVFLAAGAALPRDEGRSVVFEEVRAKRIVAVDKDGREFLVIGDFPAGVPTFPLPPAPKGTKALTMVGKDRRQAIIMSTDDWVSGATMGATIGVRAPGRTVYLRATDVGTGLVVDAGGTRSDRRGISLQTSKDKVRLCLEDWGGKKVIVEP